MLPGLKRILVIGGSGRVGAEVVRYLAGQGHFMVQTYNTGLPLEGVEALPLDLRQPEAIRSLVRNLSGPLDVVIHCAAVGRFVNLEELTEADWEEAQAVNCRSGFILCQELARRPSPPHGVVFVGAMDRSQSLPLPVHFAATQGMLAAMTMALAKEMAPATRVNMVALGPLEEGLSSRLSPKLLEDYHKFSALKRPGTIAEAARVIAWLALENSYISGKVISANGGV